jgi:multimeric flavodoxin WrbA
LKPIVIVGLVASPRKGMNTDTLVTQALNGAQEVGSDIKKIYLNDLEIKPCQACANPPKDRMCVYSDGMDMIYDLMETVDGIIIGSPAYYGSISAQLKLVVDRSNCLTEFVKFPDGKFTFRTKVRKHKKAIFIWVAGSSRDPTCALIEVKGMLKDVNAELLDSMIVLDADQGNGACHRLDLQRRAFEYGKALAKRLSE